MLLQNITRCLENWAPLSLQESYDNCGLLVGDPGMEVSKALITLDVTEDVVDEAVKNGCNLIIAHHPLIFGGLKRLNGSNSVERIVMSAIKKDIAIYAIHTNLDNISTGVNAMIARRIGLKDTRILDPKKGLLRKLVTFCPDTLLEDGTPVPDAVRNALFEAGAGHIGNYDSCSYNIAGIGTYRAGEGTNPYIGEEGVLVRQEEQRIEVIFPVYRQGEVLRKLREAHPYEEVAYDIFALDNQFNEAGSGMIGELEHEMDEAEFLQYLKQTMQTECVRYSPLLNRPVKRVAVCGGSGSFLLRSAIAQKADVLVTADFKYHQFFEAEGKIVIADIGHFESEQFTPELIREKLQEKFPNFALLVSKVKTNPINYV